MIAQVQAFVIPAAYALLPEAMRSPEASAMLIAIGLQESGFQARRQRGGPARGFWMFEFSGVRGVLEHPRSGPVVVDVLEALCYPRTLSAKRLQPILEHHDTLAACLARCLLWTLPDTLPGPDEADRGWSQYRRAWRPGKPRPDTWPAHYATAWRLVREGGGAA